MGGPWLAPQEITSKQCLGMLKATLASIDCCPVDKACPYNSSQCRHCLLSYVLRSRMICASISLLIACSITAHMSCTSFLLYGHHFLLPPIACSVSSIQSYTRSSLSLDRCSLAAFWSRLLRVRS